MKRLLLVLALMFMTAPAMAQWKVETLDGEVSSKEDFVISKTETVVTQRFSLGQVKGEILRLEAEKAANLARNIEIDGRVAMLKKEVVAKIEASKVSLKAVEVEGEVAE